MWKWIACRLCSGKHEAARRTLEDIHGTVDNSTRSPLTCIVQFIYRWDFWIYLYTILGKRRYFESEVLWKSTHRRRRFEFSISKKLLHCVYGSLRWADGNDRQMSQRQQQYVLFCISVPMVDYKVKFYSSSCKHDIGTRTGNQSKFASNQAINQSHDVTSPSTYFLPMTFNTCSVRAN